MPMTFTDEELRILGVLIEKQRSTPDYYPLTLNSLVTACNQKSNRNPVVQYTVAQVLRALDGLAKKRVVGESSGSGSRTIKYWHALERALDLSEAELSILACLMLRGPQTSGEIRSRTTRLYAFDSLDEVDQALDTLCTREDPLLMRLPRQPGQKEPRYAHLLGADPPEVPEPSAPVTTTPSSDRLDTLENEVTVLREELETLRKAFEDFRDQF